MTKNMIPKFFYFYGDLIIIIKPIINIGAPGKAGERVLGFTSGPFNLKNCGQVTGSQKRADRVSGSGKADSTEPTGSAGNPAGGHLHGHYGHHPQ